MSLFQQIKSKLDVILVIETWNMWKGWKNAARKASIFLTRPDGWCVLKTDLKKHGDEKRLDTKGGDW